MKIADEWTTIRTILDGQKSIARYGDGEFKLICMAAQITQSPNKAMCARLKEILLSQDPNLLVGVPRLWEKDMNWMPSKKRNFWFKVRKNKTFEYYLDPGKQYYSAFITRPDSAPMIETPEYWELCKKIWEGQRVILLQGEHRRFQDSDIFDRVKNLEIVWGPEREAWPHRERLLDEMIKKQADLYILSLGPTATVLAADLCEMGCWALDMGHFGVFYNKSVPKSQHWTGEPYEYDNLERVQKAK